MPRKNQPYSGANPVPKAATNLRSLINPGHGTEEKAKEIQDQGPEQDEKQTEDTVNKLQKGKRMRVRDPTTGDEVEIRNAEEDDELEDRKAQNVLNLDLPPPDWNQHKEYMLDVTTSSMMFMAAAYAISVLIIQFIPLPFISINSHWRIPFALAVPSAIAYCLIFRLRRIAQQDFEDRVVHSERLRGLRAGSDQDGDGTVETEERMKESAEWVNEFLRGVWPIINPQMFQALVDLLEDVMQSSVPKFVHSVRIADLNQGRVPLRITSIRSLHDAALDESMEELEQKEKDQLKGDHLNLEIDFAYRSAPSGRSKQSKAQNAHLLVEFFLGMRGVWASRVPIWVEIKGAVGTARVRLQLIPDPPFVKTALISLMGLPRVDIQVTPMAQALPDVMNIPVLNEFISNSLDAAAATYVAPKSLTLDLQQLISGDDIKKDTDAIGILVVHIHRATGIKKMDTTGSSDPYVTLTYSRLGKPMFSSRIIRNDLNPVFEETAFLAVRLDNVKLREKLSIQLWDSDRLSADDMLGLVEMDIAERIKNKNTSIRKVSTFESPDGKKRPGTIEFTMGYYEKMWPNSSLKTDGSDPGIPEELRNEPEFKDARATALNDLEAAVLVTPPDPEYPTGILSIQIHEITDLSVRTEGKETTGHREGEKGQDDTGTTQEEGEGLPSSYCTISINDDLVYETRVKPLSSSPMFNAGTERIIRDWRQGHITVVIKDSRVRENDAVLGIVFMKLSEIFVNASEVTRSYPVEKGGRIRISLLFRPIKVKLPGTLLGFDMGTIQLRKVTVKPDVQKDLNDCDIEAFMSKRAGPKLKISHKESKKENDGSITWNPTNDIRIAVRQRYGSALIIAFKSSGLTGGTEAIATLWMRDLIDKEPTNIDVVIWKAKSDGYDRLTQNYVPSDGNLDGWNSNKDDAVRIGTAILDITFLPGVSDAHQKMLTATDGEKKAIWDEYIREDAEGLREKVGEYNVISQKDGEEENSSVHPQDGKVAENGEPTGIVPPEEADSIDEAKEQREGDSEDDDSDGDKAKGLKEKWRQWREEEKALHRDHRGIMQRKPARTAKWIKDNVETAGHKIKERFEHQEREPDVETEV
ncbi:hypothetical protein M422DRAFT_73809 [Sphaerobolus stellatus SS14]|nr:hypothetical protein M422DRAFT_73809 [Sphaerobolus stellatus SS14]